MTATEDEGVLDPWVAEWLETHPEPPLGHGGIPSRDPRPRPWPGRRTSDPAHRSHQRRDGRRRADPPLPERRGAGTGLDRLPPRGRLHRRQHRDHGQRRPRAGPRHGRRRRFGRIPAGARDTRTRRGSTTARPVTRWALDNAGAFRRLARLGHCSPGRAPAAIWPRPSRSGCETPLRTSVAGQVLIYPCTDGPARVVPLHESSSATPRGSGMDYGGGTQPGEATRMPFRWRRRHWQGLPPALVRAGRLRSAPRRGPRLRRPLAGRRRRGRRAVLSSASRTGSSITGTRRRRVPGTTSARGSEACSSS